MTTGSSERTNIVAGLDEMIKFYHEQKQDPRTTTMSAINEEDYEGEYVCIGASKFKLDEPVGSGAEGGVYRVKELNSVVVKIFTQAKRAEKEEKVRAMIANPPADPTHEHSDVRSIIWPTDIVEDPSTGSFIGYLMPYKNLRAKNARRYARENLDWEKSDEEERLRTALNLSLVVQAIHKQGHAMGDYNHQNILIEDGVVSLIDCDSFHVKGVSRSYSDDTFFPRYTPPEGRGDNLEQVRKSDRFQLGVHLFQLLMEGFHPFQAKGGDAASGDFATMIRENPFAYEGVHSADIEPHDQAPDYRQLPTEVRDLFSDCFSEVAKGPGWGRPEARKWTSTLSSLVRMGPTDVNDIFRGSGDATGTTGPPGPTGDSDSDPEPSGMFDADTLWGESDSSSSESETSGTSAEDDDDDGPGSIDIEEDLGW